MLMRFDREGDAEEYVADTLAPFCCSLKRQPEIGNGLRPDLGVRFKIAPDIPICIEVKSFKEGPASTLCSAIAQASTYADCMKNPALVGPLAATGVLGLSWNAEHKLGSALLLAGHFNVGGVYFSGHGSGKVGGVAIAGVGVLTFSFDEWGDPVTTPHRDFQTLLTYKHRAGSITWRNP